MKISHFVIGAITLLFTMMNSSCGGNDEDVISPALKPSDINLSIPLVEYSANWLTNGQTLTIEIKDLDYSSVVPGVNLSSIKIEKDGDVITTAPYKKNSPINVKVNGWSHGENTIKIIAVFKSDDSEIEKEICTPCFVVFNELPKYDIEGFYTDTVVEIDEISGLTHSITYSATSENHVFSGCASMTAIDALSGKVYNLTTRPNNPSFFINEDVTNFDAKISKTELHWHTQDGPSSLAKDEELKYPVNLYAQFSVSGVHEDITISQETTIVFSFIKK